jgi:hypothetical protein
MSQVRMSDDDQVRYLIRHYDTLIQKGLEDTATVLEKCATTLKELNDHMLSHGGSIVGSTVMIQSNKLMHTIACGSAFAIRLNIKKMELDAMEHEKRPTTVDEFRRHLENFGTTLWPVFINN